MGVDRGLGDLEATCVVFLRSADLDKIIDLDLDCLGVGFTEGKDVTIYQDKRLLIHIQTQNEDVASVLF